MSHDMHKRLFLAGWALVVVAVGSAPARSDLISLVTGEPLVGEVVQADEGGIVFRSHRGGVFEIAWDRIYEADRMRIEKDWGLVVDESVEPVLVPGRKVVLKDGTVYVGVVLREDDRLLQLRMLGNQTPIPRDRIASTSDVMVDALEVYRPAEIVAQRRREMEPQTPAELYELAQFAQRVGAYEEAKTLLEGVATADPDYQSGSVRTQRASLDRLIADRALLDQAASILADHRNGLISRALAGLGELSSSHPDSPVLRDLARRGVTREKLERQVHELDVRRIARAWMPEVRSRIDVLARDREITMAEAAQVVKRQLEKEVLATLAERFAMDAKQVEALFKERGRSTKVIGSYGSGTYIVYQKEKKPPAPSTPSRRRPGQSAQQRTNRPKIEKRPPEEWWAQMDLPERRRFLLAIYGESSKLVEILRVEFDKCKTCGGQGYQIIYATGSGGNTQALCDRCFGVGVDKKVIFR